MLESSCVARSTAAFSESLDIRDGHPAETFDRATQHGDSTPHLHSFTGGDATFVAMHKLRKRDVQNRKSRVVIPASMSIKGPRSSPAASQGRSWQGWRRPCQTTGRQLERAQARAGRSTQAAPVPIVGAMKVESPCGSRIEGSPSRSMLPRSMHPSTAAMIASSDQLRGMSSGFCAKLGTRAKGMTSSAVVPTRLTISRK